jgi:hypothetical protein
MQKEQTIVIAPDLQVPLHARKHVDNFIDFLNDYQPSMLVNVGDDADFTEVGQWVRGLAREYAPTLQRNVDATRDIHTRMREAIGDVPYHVSRSNHGDRMRRYIAAHAPALSTLRSLDLNVLLGYTDLGIEYHKQPFDIAPGWLCAHGDEGTMSRIPGKTALGLAEKFGKSVVCGHTHKAAIVPSTRGFNGTTVNTFGLEVGHMMDVKKATYMKAGHANWQTAFGILRVRGSRVYPQLVFIESDGSFYVDGNCYPSFVKELRLIHELINAKDEA